MQMMVAAEADFAEIVTLANWAYRGRADDVESWNQEKGFIEGVRITESLLREELAHRPDGALLVFRDDPGSRLLGTAWVDPLGAGKWHLSLLTVSPAHQTRKLGTRFLTAAEDFAAARGGHTMRIEVLSVRDALIAWYERRGFVQTGEREPFPYGDRRFGTPLRDGLEFLILEKPLQR